MSFKTSKFDVTIIVQQMLISCFSFFSNNLYACYTKIIFEVYGIYVMDFISNMVFDLGIIFTNLTI